MEDIFNICKATGLRPPLFDADAQHFMVTVYRPRFDGQGNRLSSADEEAKAKKEEVGLYPGEVKAYPEEVTAKSEEVKANPDFKSVMKGYRRDLRETCAKVWSCLNGDSLMTQRSNCGSAENFGK